MEDEGAERPSATPDREEDEKKKLAIHFKAQHALVVAFFVLLLYVWLLLHS